MSPIDPAESRRREWVKLMNVSVVGMVFPVSMVLGYLGGRFVGSWFESAQAGGLIGGLLGLMAGFYNVFKIIAKLDPRPRRDDGSKEDV